MTNSAQAIHPSDTAKSLRQSADISTLHTRDMQIFAVYDKKAMSYAPPFYYHQKGQAIRAFDDAVNDPQSPLNKHPEDFCIFHMGSWNDTTGVLTPLPNPVPLEEALNCVKAK